MKKFLSEFKDFAVKGNMVDMSVGIVIGAAFTALVNDGLVGCLVTPLLNWVISLITGGSDVDHIAGNVGPFPLGTLLGTIINFIVTAFILFIVVKAINQLRNPLALFGKAEEVEEEAPTTKECPYCKSEVHIEATKCPHCTSDL